MKIKRYSLDRMTIGEFADMHNLTMEIRERHPRDESDRFYAHFERAEVIQGGCLIGEYGNGRTEEDAIASYAESISGKRLAIGAYTADRREIQVPVLSR